MSKLAPAEVAPVETPAPKTECANGHPRAEFWTTTASGRSYCKACARAASKASKAKNAKPNPRRLTPELHALLEDLFRSSKKGSAELRDEAAAWFDANR